MYMNKVGKSVKWYLKGPLVNDLDDLFIIRASYHVSVHLSWFTIPLTCSIYIQVFFFLHISPTLYKYFLLHPDCKLSVISLFI